MSHYANISFNSATGKWEAKFKGAVLSSSRNKDYIVFHISSGGSSKARKMGVIGVEEGGVVLEHFTIGSGTQQAVQTESHVSAPIHVTTLPRISINKRFGYLENFSNMLIAGEISSLIVTGEGGLGKTFTVKKCLNETGLSDIRDYAEINDTREYGESVMGDYIIIKGNTSAKGLYRALYENRDKIVVFDDCDKALTDVIAQQVLKAALDSYDRRIISWNTEMNSRDEKLPKFFEFTGRIIFISNMAQHKLDQAIKSRSLRVDLTMNTQEKLERMEFILEDIEPSLNIDFKRDALEFLKKHADEATDLNIRTLLTVTRIRASRFTKNWEEEALYTLTA